jgi:hypothetical protein
MANLQMDFAPDGPRKDRAINQKFYLEVVKCESGVKCKGGGVH